jgi:16S rRNA (uracil1498-N3)-methyltransferase
VEYFYSPPECISTNQLTIEEDEFSHLTHVMRKNVGDSICVVDGAGMAYEVTITDIHERTAVCSIRSRRAGLNEPRTVVTLGVGLLKNSAKFDFLVEKATEIGATTIVPLITKRTIPEHAKTERWQKIALAAMKQSGRCVLPAIGQLTRFESFVSGVASADIKLIPHENAEAPIHELLAFGRSIAQPRSATICVGPEGGFTEEEVQQAKAVGFVPVCLGKRRLRTETAAIVTLYAVLLCDGHAGR